MTRVVIHIGVDGAQTIYADPGACVLFVDERAPNDRVYRMSPDEIPDGLTEGPWGQAGDGSPAATRTVYAVRTAMGEHAFDVIDGDASHRLAGVVSDDHG